MPNMVIVISKDAAKARGEALRLSVQQGKAQDDPLVDTPTEVVLLDLDDGDVIKYQMKHCVAVQFT